LRTTRVIHQRDALRGQTERQAQEFNALYTVGKKITASFDLAGILSLVVTAAVNLTRAEEGALMLLDAETGALYMRASRNFAEPDTQQLLVKVHDSLMGRVIQSARPVMMAGPDLVKVKTSFLVKAILAVPLMVGSSVIGVLSVDNQVSNRVFDEHEVHLLSALADSAAIAIVNARLYQEARRQAGEMAALLEIDRHISSTLDLTTVLERIAIHAEELLKADNAEVFLTEPDGCTLKAVVALGEYAEEIRSMSITLGEGVVGHIAQSRVAEIVNDMQHDPRALHVPGTPDQPEMLMCAPLISKDELVGVMVAVRLGDRPLFTQNDLGFLIGLAGQAVIAIQNARLYISEQTRAAELARALERQHELDRLKTEFIQNISHELRTPLAIVRGYAEMLDTGAFGELSSDQREPISVMARRSRMLSKMLDDLVAILSLEPRHMANEAIDLPDLVQNMLADFQSAAKQAGLRLMSEVAAGSLVIKGDAIQMRRVFDNLLSNACKFTQAGGSVTVRLSRDGGRAVFEVADTGIGIPADKLDRIFERFYQVDGSATRRYGGVGLGLALVKEIVEAHRGQVTAQSQLGEGTTFRITLPVMPENS